jgi:parvulin-like peptidyl-prolyl isomerase
MRIKKQLILIIIAILLVSSSAFVGFSEIIEKIYAVVNGELITYSELKSTEAELTRVLSQQYKGEELKQKVEEMKKNLLERLIEQKLILSYAKDKDYDVDNEVELIIKDLKKQNNINSDEELKAAIAAQGMDYEAWKNQIKDSRIQQKYVYDEIGSKIKIDNSAIMDYYKKNIKDYTIPPKITLNCIFLSKQNYLDPKALEEKKEAINEQLKKKPFEEVAKTYSELPGSENNYFLGEFKKGELDSRIEAAALPLKKGEYSGWIETDTGWYIVQLINLTESQLVEYKSVRENIENKLKQAEQEKRLKAYIEQLKKESYIKIYSQFDQDQG